MIPARLNQENTGAPLEVGTAVEFVAGRAAFSVDEFCKVFGISRRLAYDQIKAGALRVRKVGRRTLIRACDARLWLDALPTSSN